MLTLAALADSTRRKIVEMLAVRDRTAGEIVAEFQMTAPAISQHLKVLRRAGLITVRPQGQRRIHSLDPSGLHELETWLAKTKRAWERRHDSAERDPHAEHERKASKE
jgi:DNA-binding transcriptional ArsR family regulator